MKHGEDRLRVAVVGATGYVGSELLRLLLGHRRVSVRAIVGHGKAGEPIARVLPAFRGVLDGVVEAFSASAIAEAADVVFTALPHGASATIVRELRVAGVTTLDLSADFRLKDLAAIRAWYGEPGAPELLPEAVYGLPDLHRDAIAKANLIAVPGCYPTASILGLAPLVANGLVETDGLIVDAKSGVSGAGKAPTQGTHYSEVEGGIRAYKVAGQHRHTAEIEQELGHLAGKSLKVTFTPHLVPMVRGILATAYGVPRTANLSVDELVRAARSFFGAGSGVHVLEPGENPDTGWVRGTNRVHISYAIDGRTERVIAQTTIDNLVKGAAGQAIQCMNLRFGFEELEGLEHTAVYP